MPHPISKWPEGPLSHSLYPGYESGLRTPVQCQFSLERAHCSNSISHSNKLYFPLILSHAWKFFSNPHLDHDTTDIQHWVSLRCTACWFDIFVYCNMITTIALSNTIITSHNHHFFFFCGKNIYSLVSATFKFIIQWKWKRSRSVMSDSLRPHGL